MNYEEDVSYSFSCIPPDVHINPRDNRAANDDVQRTVVKFPTLFGKSLGFTRFTEFDCHQPIDKLNKSMKHRSSSANGYIRKSDQCYNLQHMSTKQSYNSMDLNRRVFQYNRAPALPKSFNPRAVKRGNSFNQIIMQPAAANVNTNTDDYYNY